MQSVVLNIMNIIETIDAAGNEAEGQESPECLYEILLIQQVVAEEQWGEYKGILKSKHPSLGTKVRKF